MDTLNALTMQAMTLCVLDDVHAIEIDAYEFPWSRQNFVDALNAQYSGFLLMYQQTIIGYAVVMHILDEAHLLNFTIAPRYQRQGFGKHFLTSLCNWSISHHARTMLLEVRIHNLAAIHLYQLLDFQQIGIRKNYYPAANGSREHGLVFEKKFVKGAV